MVIATGVALGIATFFTVYVVFGAAGKVLGKYATEADDQGNGGKALFLYLLAIVSVGIAFAGGIGAGLLVALSIIGV